MKKEKVYKINSSDKLMIDAFKNEVLSFYNDGLYFRNYTFEEVHNKDGYCIIAVLDYGKFKAKLKYNPLYLFSDFLDVSFDLGGKYKYSIYDIFNLFDIDDFNQYYYTDIEIETNMNKYIKSMLEMITKYSYDIVKASDTANLLILDSNVEQDYFALYNSEDWKEDADDELEWDIRHPSFLDVSDATNSAKLYKKMSKLAQKNKLNTIYEKRLYEHLKSGNTVVNNNEVEKTAKDKKYNKLYNKTAFVFFAVSLLYSVLFTYGVKALIFKGAYVPLTENIIGTIILPFNLTELFICIFAAILLTIGLNGLFGKMIIAKKSNNDKAIIKKFENEESGISRHKAGMILKKAGDVICLTVGLLVCLVSFSDTVGFYDDSAKIGFGGSVAYEDLSFVEIKGEYDENDYYEFTDSKYYGVYDTEHNYAVLRNMEIDSEGQKYIEKIISDYNKELTEYKTVEDFEDDMHESAERK